MISNKLSLYILLNLFFVNPIFAKRYIKKKYNIAKEFINQNSWFKIKSLEKILAQEANISYRQICGSLYFEYPQFCISYNFPHKGYFDKLFVLSIPQGVIQGHQGYVFSQDQMIDELVWKQRYNDLLALHNKKFIVSDYIHGRVAVIAQVAGELYYHFLYECLARLALIEMSKTEYDKLYISIGKKFVKEFLQLWGIDEDKIILSTNSDFCIQADEVILPSLVINTSAGHNFAGQFISPLVINYVREKLLRSLEKNKLSNNDVCKKIFISRKDANFPRKIINEDQVFALFEAKGFERYILSEMTVAEQINLFAHADIVVSEHGAGLSNILFCKPNTKIIEIFHTLIDNAYWMVSQVLGLDYKCYQMCSVNMSFFTDLENNFAQYAQQGMGQTVVSLDKIQKIIDRL